MREATFTPPASESATTLPANNSPGLAAILRGTRSALQADETLTADPPPASALPRSRKRQIQLSLMVADVVQFGFAAYLMHRGHFGFLEIALCVLAVVSGAWLTCLALLLD